jgi:hypothetical protein
MREPAENRANRRFALFGREKPGDLQRVTIPRVRSFLARSYSNRPGISVRALDWCFVRLFELASQLCGNHLATNLDWRHRANRTPLLCKSVESERAAFPVNHRRAFSRVDLIIDRVRFSAACRDIVRIYTLAYIFIDIENRHLGLAAVVIWKQLSRFRVALNA